MTTRNDSTPQTHVEAPDKGVGCGELVQPSLEATDNDDREWHITSDWSERIAICGCELEGKAGLPGEEVPDEDTCAKCLSVEASVYYRFLKSPAMRCKVWLVG